MGEENKDWIQEQQRVDMVVREIERKKEIVQEKAAKIKGDVVGLRESFWDDVTVNLDEPDDVIETHTSIRQQTELVSERERSHGLHNKELKNLERLKYSPYFGRIDFKEEGEGNTDVIYIGTASLMDKNDEDFLIYDWRAPISSLYYDYPPGPASYHTPVGTLRGNIAVKRQYIIRNSKIKGMFDTGVTIGDEMLQAVLGDNADTKMKSIVATIQKEQNQIIRNERSKFLVVQGVAGSGKTSAALQRVAYLLYRYRESITSEHIMLFSPNPLFNSYISTVLPELGEENVQQTTFHNYVSRRLGKRYEIEDPFAQMEFLLTAEHDNEYKIRVEAIRYKASLSFKEQLDRYVSSLSNQGLKFKNIPFKGKIIVSADEMYEYFYSLERSLPIPNRMEMLSEWIIQKLKKIEKEERKKKWVTEESELLGKEELVSIYEHLQNKKRFSEDTFDDFDREQAMIAKVIVRKYFRPIQKKVKALAFIDSKAIFAQFFTLEKETELWSDLCSFTLEQLKQNKLMNEDATPYLYLQDRITGRKSNTSIRHLFIDEAQDYTPFQFMYLKELFPNSKITMLGDFNQAIYAHTINAPTILSGQLFPADEMEKIELTRSYRSTKQITEFTKALLKDGEFIEPFNRDGLKPTLQVVANADQLKENMIKKVQHLKNSGHNTIAIICKTFKESEEAYRLLKDDLDTKLMTLTTSSFENGVLIVPSYLAKGIEFDAVLIFNCSIDQYGHEFERKLFYTACTRAMHELHLYSIGEPTNFLQEVPVPLYEKN